MQIWVEDNRRHVKRQHVIKHDLHCIYKYFIGIQKRKILNKMASKGWIKAYELPTLWVTVDKQWEEGGDIQESRGSVSDSRLEPRLPLGSGKGV